MKKPSLLLILPCILLSHLTFAEDFAMQAHSQGDVTFISGGVGIEEQNTLRAMQMDYNLNLLFSVQGTGKYLSNVKVIITNSQGTVFLDTVANGPKLFANLKPGHYIVTANQGDRVVRKTVTIGTHRSSLYFTWPQN